ATAAQAAQFDAATNTVTFDSTNWNTAFTVKVAEVDGATIQDAVLMKIGHTVSSSLGAGVYSSVGTQKSASFTVYDSRVASLIVQQSASSTLVSQNTQDAYFLRLTKAPTGNVVVTFPNDGLELVSALDPTDTRFSIVNGQPQVTFNSTNWSTPFLV